MTSPNPYAVIPFLSRTVKWPHLKRWAYLTLKCKTKIILISAHENMKEQPSKVAHNSQPAIFLLPAWLPKRPILGRNRNFIGSPCLLSTISLLVLDFINAFIRSHLIQKIFYDFQSIKEGKIKKFYFDESWRLLIEKVKIISIKI